MPPFRRAIVILVFSLGVTSARAQGPFEAPQDEAPVSAAPVSAAASTPSASLSAGSRLTLWEMAAYRAQLQRLWARVPFSTASRVLAGAGVGLAFAGLADLVRRRWDHRRSGWGDSEEDPFVHSPAAAVIGVAGAVLVLTGLILHRRARRAGQPFLDEIRRIEAVLAADARLALP